MNAIIPPAAFEKDLVQGSVKKAAAAVGARSGDLWLVPASALRIIPGFNVRVTGTPQWDASIRALADSMLENGFYRDKPFTAYVQKEGDENLFMVTDGHRRYEALQIALAADPERFSMVPVIVKPPGESLEDLTVALAKTGEPLTPFEYSIVCKRLLQNGVMTVEDVARRLNITTHYVNDLLLLQGAAAGVRKFVIDGTISATLAINELKKDPKGLADRLKEAVANARRDGKEKATARHLPTPARDASKATPATTGEAAKEEAPAANRPGRKPNPNNRVIEFKGLAGAEYPLSQISEFAKLSGGDWHRLHEDKPGVVVLTEDVNIKITMKRKPAPPGQDVTADANEIANEAADL